MSATALPPSASTITIPSILSIPISEKLTKTNYFLWRAQVLPAIRATQFEDLLTSDDLLPEKTIVITNIYKTTSSISNPD
jgi:hypothetical protein